MPVFRGNVGNLLQHWVLCETLLTLREDAEQIDFVDAYSMSPFANERPKLDGSAHLFDYVQRGLPGAGSAYERAWHDPAVAPGRYPNSAVFLTRVWPGRYSLLLCEWDPATVRELEAWAVPVRDARNCTKIEVAPGDWRSTFRKGFDVSGHTTFISFDPYMFDRHGSGRNPGNMDPGDLTLLSEAVHLLKGRLVVQLSTFSANNANRQEDVIDAVTSALKPHEICPLCIVSADGNMMSLLLGRGVAPQSTWAKLPNRFSNWLSDVKSGYRAEQRAV